MAEPLKHLIGPHTARDTADAVARAWGPFDHAAFLTDTLPGIDSLELMQRASASPMPCTDICRATSRPPQGS